MPTPLSASGAAAVIAVYLLVLFAPGLLIGALAGARGWLLAGLAPVLTYFAAGLAGPWFAQAGIPFNLPSFLAAVAVLAGIAWVAGWRRVAVEGVWDRRGHVAVGLCLLAGGAVGARTVLSGMGRLNAVPQGYDAVYHGNGIRYLAETGDGSLVGTGTVNWYPNGSFYPNAYHLVGSLVYRLTGAEIPAVLNANTVLLPGLLALSLVVLVRWFRGRAVTAGAVALVCVAPVTLLYEALNFGPLLPFLLGIALTPLVAVVLDGYLRRPAFDTGFLLVAVAVGLLTIHSSTLFGGLLFALPLLVAHRRTLWRLWPVAVAGLLLGWLQLFGAIGLAAGPLPYNGWPTAASTNTAVGMLLTFEHVAPHPQLWLSAALLVGIVLWQRLGPLRWVAATALLFGVFAVAVLSSGHPLVKAVSRPWWNDPYRFLVMAAVPCCLLAAHGLAEVQRWLRNFAPRWAWVAGVVTLAGFAVTTNGLYTTSNAVIVRPGYPSTGDIPLNTGEAQAMLELARLASPGDWAVNDRSDGTAWTYALSGVRTTAGHFDPALPPADYVLLAGHFREYATNAAVRDAVARLNIRWVILGHGGYPRTAVRPAGLRDLDGLPFLRVAYRNADAVVYQLVR
ncbi:copper-transporting ATPase [Amycolatopsis thermalba]|uniref:Copper-transporting ATPase n=1 Tax=Amycolatopsis thermalba TaxID=944492 RepID=A0ABY4NQC2_9PSEU|nr:DUF6541 family protein [Amycolatopsis thermalba]UQS21968.1 copper-transporting ATPase [Amycolatopsis thermalba]